MSVKIRKSNKASYYENYEIEVETTKDLTSEEYKTITDAMSKIAGVLDPYFEELKANQPPEEEGDES